MDDNKEKTAAGAGTVCELNEKDLAGVTGGVNNAEGVSKLMKTTGRLKENYECPYCHEVNTVYIIGTYTMPSDGMSVLVARLKCYNCNREYQEKGSSFKSII